MKVNGEVRLLDTNVSLAEFLSAEGYSVTRIAVERNGSIIPKGEYANVVLSDTDTLEVVTFVGGG